LSRRKNLSEEHINTYGGGQQPGKERSAKWTVEEKTGKKGKPKQKVSRKRARRKQVKAPNKTRFKGPKRPDDYYLEKKGENGGKSSVSKACQVGGKNEGERDANVVGGKYNNGGKIRKGGGQGFLGGAQLGRRRMGGFDKKKL